MGATDDIVQKIPTPDLDSTLTEVLGYLNFSNGAADSRFQKNLDRLHDWFTPIDGRLPVYQLLNDKLSQLTQTSSAFRDGDQARYVLSLVFEHALPEYRRFHADLLAHVPEEDFCHPLFVARVFEAVLAQRPPWIDVDRIVAGAIKQLNDFVGHRPVAVLETKQGTAYPHERFRPVPLFIKGVGVAQGRYHDVVENAFDILRRMPADLLASAYFNIDLMDELALDLRAYDHGHPAYKRTNYTFGEWDPYCIDVSGRYRRFVVRAVILDALCDWIKNADKVPDDERVREASAVLAGTMLMASSVSGSGPDTHDSNSNLSSLLPRIARQRDAFYSYLLESMQGKHADRLRREAQLVKQPFGRIRQHLNLYLANYGCRQMQRAHLAYLYARMGFADAARQQAAIIPAAATRFETDIQTSITLSRFDLDHEKLADAAPRVSQVEETILRGIDCGAIVDPWNILGFQGHFPLFISREDSVSDPRVDKLIAIMDQLFHLETRLVCEAAAAGRADLCQSISSHYRELGAFWDKFATTTVSDLPAVYGMASAESAERVSKAILAWHREGAAAGDVGFWKRHIDQFESLDAYAIVVELLLKKKDAVSAMNLLLQWLSMGREINLESGAYSFHVLLVTWLNFVLGRRDAESWPLARRMLDSIEVNAGDWGVVPRLDSSGDGSLKLTDGLSPGERIARSDRRDEEGADEGDDALFGGRDEDEESDDSDSLFGAAYENVVFRDSAQDGVQGDTVDDSQHQADTDLDRLSVPLENRLRYLVTVSQAWCGVADWLLGLSRDGGLSGSQSAQAEPIGSEQLEALRRWQRLNEVWLADLGGLMESLVTWEPVDAGSDLDSIGEYDRQLHVKFGLLNSAISAAVVLSDTARTMKAILKPPGKTGGKDSDEPVTKVLRLISKRDAEGVRRQIPGLLKYLQRKPLLYVPIDRGGRPKDILASRNLQSLIRFLLQQLPRMGLFRESWHVLKTAYLMERTSPPSGMSITEFDRLLESALQATLAAVIQGTDSTGAPLSDEYLWNVVESMVEPYMRLWLKHSATMRLSSVEAMKESSVWRKVKAFIKDYGSELFHPRMVSLGNLRGILQQGAESFFDYLAENDDPLEPMKLLEDLDRTLSRGEAAFVLESILRSLVEKFDRFLEYNSTTTQSDYGEQLHTLLDFMRLEAEYERQAWNLAPMELVHEMLSRLGRTAVADRWRAELESKTAPIAKNYMRKLEKLEKKYGMKLPGITDRISEQFVKPLALDRILALVKPAMQDARRGVMSASFEKLQKEAEEYLSTTQGSPLDVQPWLQTLEEEVQIVESDAQSPVSSFYDDSPASDGARIDLDDLGRQLRNWEQPLLPEAKD